MNISKPFILRPVATTLLTLALAKRRGHSWTAAMNSLIQARHALAKQVKESFGQTDSIKRRLSLVPLRRKARLHEALVFG